MTLAHLARILLGSTILAGAASSWAQSPILLSGVLGSSSPTYNRLSDRLVSGSYTDSANNAVPYFVQAFTMPAGGTFTATVLPTTAIDSFLTLYSAFNPATPAANVLAADDDSGGYPHAALKSGLQANTTYYLVVASYAGTGDTAHPRYGNFDLSLSSNIVPLHGITVTANPVPGGTVACTPNPVSNGSNSTCNAIPNAGYSFASFSGDCTGTTCTLANVTSAKSVTANFVPLYPITLAVAPPSSGSVICTVNPVPQGGNSTCTATPNSGFTFANFSGDCTGSACVFTNVASPKAATANFKVSTTLGLVTTPKPSDPGETVMATINLTPASNVGALSGSIIVSGDQQSCTITVGSTNHCQLIFTTKGMKSLTANYSGNDQYAPSSASLNHRVGTVTGITPILMLLMD